MSRHVVTPEEAHDFASGAMPPVRRSAYDMWIAFLVGLWAGGLMLLLAMAFMDSLPNAGDLRGCEGLSAGECAAFAEER